MGKRNAFYAQSGGVTAVINASAAGVIETARKHRNHIRKLYAGRDGISGALTEEAFLASLERAGFYGVAVLKKSFWREVEGCKFYSVTVRGYKFEKKSGCTYVGQYAVYLGPLKAAIDEEGHLFPRGTAIEVCTDTAAKLSRAPYAGSFAIGDSPAGAREIVDGCCTPGGECC